VSLNKPQRNKKIKNPILQKNYVFKTTNSIRINTEVLLLTLYFYTRLTDALPPVTSHIASMGELSLGTSPTSRSNAGVPDSRRTSENSRWSQRNGSRVSSEPGIGECIGKLN
jgi:hypothetical protein